MVPAVDTMVDTVPETALASASGASIGASEGGTTGASVGGAPVGTSAGTGTSVGDGIIAAIGATSGVQLREHPLTKSVMFCEISSLFKMTHLKTSSANSLQAGQRVVIGQRDASISTHDSISSVVGIEAISSSVGRRVKHRFLIAQGKRSLSS